MNDLDKMYGYLFAGYYGSFAYLDILPLIVCMGTHTSSLLPLSQVNVTHLCILYIVSVWA